MNDSPVDCQNREVTEPQRERPLQIPPHLAQKGGEWRGITATGGTKTGWHRGHPLRQRIHFAQIIKAGRRKRRPLQILLNLVATP